MAQWEWWLVDATGTLILLLTLYAVALVLRRRFLSRRGGTFELSRHRAGSADTHGWALGVGRYSGEQLEWFRIFTPSLRPADTWRRVDLRYVGHRAPRRAEQAALFAGHVVVDCRAGAVDLELAMSPSALTGFQAWLEAAPPGEVPQPA